MERTLDSVPMQSNVSKQSQKDLIDTYELLLTRNVTIKLP